MIGKVTDRHKKREVKSSPVVLATGTRHVSEALLVPPFFNKQSQPTAHGTEQPSLCPA